MKTSKRELNLPFKAWWIFVSILLGACSDGSSSNIEQQPTNPSYSPVQQFEGLYKAGAEMSSFVPCDLKELPGAGVGYWLIPNGGFLEMYENPSGVTLAEQAGTYGPYDQFSLYVRFEGRLWEDPNETYGPLGDYSGEIIVTKAIEAKRKLVGSSYPPGEFWGCRR